MRGNAFLAQGNANAALQDFKLLLDKGRASEEVYVGLARSSMEGGSFSEARAYVDKLRELNPDNREIRRILVDISGKEGVAGYNRTRANIEALTAEKIEEYSSGYTGPTGTPDEDEKFVEYVIQNHFPSLVAPGTPEAQFDNLREYLSSHVLGIIHLNGLGRSQGNNDGSGSDASATVQPETGRKTSPTLPQILSDSAPEEGEINPVLEAMDVAVRVNSSRESNRAIISTGVSSHEPAESYPVEVSEDERRANLKDYLDKIYRIDLVKADRAYHSLPDEFKTTSREEFLYSPFNKHVSESPEEAKIAVELASKSRLKEYLAANPRGPPIMPKQKSSLEDAISEAPESAEPPKSDGAGTPPKPEDKGPSGPTEPPKPATPGYNGDEGEPSKGYGCSPGCAVFKQHEVMSEQLAKSLEAIAQLQSHATEQRQVNQELRDGVTQTQEEVRNAREAHAQLAERTKVNYQGMVKEAEGYFAAGNYEGAAYVFATLLKTAQQDTSTGLDTGNLGKRLKDSVVGLAEHLRNAGLSFEEEYRRYEAILNIVEHPTVRANMGMTAYDLGQRELAREHLSRAFSSDRSLFRETLSQTKLGEDADLVKYFELKLNFKA